MIRRLMLSVALLIFIFSSCHSRLNLPEMVKIDGELYRISYDGTLYPTDESSISEIPYSVQLCRFYRYNGSEYDCYITYNDSAEPVLYFAEEQFDAAKAYYDDPMNYRYYYLVGNIFEEHEVFNVPDMDPEKLDALIAFGDKYDYDPTTSFQTEVETRWVPVQNDWTAGELRFYKESNDGCFTSFTGHIFQMVDGALVMVYSYDLENEDGYRMEVVDLPSELSEYFIEVIK